MAFISRKSNSSTVFAENFVLIEINQGIYIFFKSKIEISFQQILILMIQMLIYTSSNWFQITYCKGFNTAMKDISIANVNPDTTKFENNRRNLNCFQNFYQMLQCN